MDYLRFYLIDFSMSNIFSCQIYAILIVLEYLRSLSWLGLVYLEFI